VSPDESGPLEEWESRILEAIRAGNHRFESIQQEIKYARNILSDRLSQLVEKGLVGRRAYSTAPPRYEYFINDDDGLAGVGATVRQ
jgi:DNA-binding HxlR family transcriptional regulator